MLSLRRITGWVILLILFTSLSAQVRAAIRLPKIIGDHMVLQCDQTAPIWGWAEPGEKITLKFKGKTYTAVANIDKGWALKLPAQKQGGPYDMEIEGENTIKLTNILIGDVYVCSGQSNMEFKLGNLLK